MTFTTALRISCYQQRLRYYRTMPPPVSLARFPIPTATGTGSYIQGTSGESAFDRTTIRVSAVLCFIREFGQVGPWNG